MTELDDGNGIINSNIQIANFAAGLTTEAKTATRSSSGLTPRLAT